MSAPAPAPMSLYGRLRMNATDALPRVVNMNWWRTTHRRERRRYFKKILLNRRRPT